MDTTEDNGLGLALGALDNSIELEGRSFTLSRLRVRDLPAAIRHTQAVFAGPGLLQPDKEMVVSLTETNLAALKALVLLCADVAPEELEQLPVTPFLLLFLKVLAVNSDFFYPRMREMAAAPGR